MKLVILALCSLSLAVPALGLKCYQCSSDDGENCNDPFSATGINTKQCEPLDSSTFWDNMARVSPGIHPPSNTLNTRSTAPVCIKFVAVLNGQKQTVRDCSPITSSAACSILKGSLEAENAELDSCDGCEEDLCNSAPRDLFAMSTALVSSLVLALRSF